MMVNVQEQNIIFGGYQDMRDCEPLRGKRKPTMFSWDNFCADDVGSAVRFYKKWNMNMGGFYKKYKTELRKNHKIRSLGDFFKNHERFCDWLFDYCFQDMVQ